MIIDLIALLLIIYGFYAGFSRGLIKTLFDTLSIILAIVISLKFSPIVINLIDGAFNFSPAIGFIVGFVVTFFVVMLLIRLIGKKLEGFLKAFRINFVNKFAGGVLMALVFAYCFSGLLWLSDELDLLSEKSMQTSISYPVLKPLPRVTSELFSDLRPMFQEFWDKTMETMDHIKEKAES